MISMERLEEIQIKEAQLAMATDQPGPVRVLAAEIMEIVEELINWRREWDLSTGGRPLPRWVKK